MALQEQRLYAGGVARACCETSSLSAASQAPMPRWGRGGRDGGWRGRAQRVRAWGLAGKQARAP
eukprot:7765712-Lingulodinium_polyedra.AAC.1